MRRGGTPAQATFGQVALVTRGLVRPARPFAAIPKRLRYSYLTRSLLFGYFLSRRALCDRERVAPGSSVHVARSPDHAPVLEEEDHPVVLTPSGRGIATGRNLIRIERSGNSDAEHRTLHRHPNVSP